MYIGIDIGTGSSKTAVNIDGRIEGKKYQFAEEVVDGSIHRAEPFIDHLRELFTDLVHTARSRGEKIEGIALDGHSPSLLVLDGKGSPATDILTWQDTRASGLRGELYAAGVPEEKRELGYESKALWLLRNEISPKRPDGASRSDDASRSGGTARSGGISRSDDAARSGGATLLSPKDFVVHLLTGERVTDRASALTIYFYNDPSGFDTAERLGLPRDLFPPVIEPWEPAGETGTAFSREVGLDKGIPVYGGGIDAWCEALGAGATHPGELVEGTGTSTCITLCRERGEGMNYHVVPGYDMDIETLSYTGGSLLWAIDLVGKNPSSLEELDLSEPSQVLFLPYLAGERSPVWDPDASGSFVGLGKSTDTHEFLRATLQGVGFAIRQNIELLTSKAPVGHTVRAVGGANVSNAWLKEKAALTGYVYRKMKILDAAPFGAWLLAAYGAGYGDLDELVSEFNAVEEEFPPPEKRDERIEHLYREYTRLYKILQPVMHNLAGIKRKTGSMA